MVPLLEEALARARAFCDTAAAMSVGEITAVDLAARLQQQDPPCLLDVRGQREFDYARIEGALLIPLPELAGRIEELDPTREHVVYCHLGVRSLSGAAILERAGFVSVSSLKGGIEAWSRSVDPKVPRY